MSVITICGELGSGAPEIGRQIADHLNACYLDQKIISELSVRLNCTKEEVKRKVDSPTNVFDRMLKSFENCYECLEMLGKWSVPPSQLPLDDFTFLDMLDSVLREFASKGFIVIYGKGGQFFFKNEPEAFHVRVIAPLGMRVQRVMRESSLTKEEAEQEIRRFHCSDSQFIKKYFWARIENPIIYDLVINTNRISFSSAALTLIYAFTSRMNERTVPKI